jgi:hypothetical protein
MQSLLAMIAESKITFVEPGSRRQVGGPIPVRLSPFQQEWFGPDGALLMVAAGGGIYAYNVDRRALNSTDPIALSSKLDHSL